MRPSYECTCALNGMAHTKECDAEWYALDARATVARKAASSLYFKLSADKQPLPSAFDAADRCGFCNGFGDGLERHEFIAEWCRLTAHRDWS